MAGEKKFGPCQRGPWSADAIRKSMLCYAVTDRAWLRGRTLASCVEAAIAGGATFIQLREKKASVEETEKLALELKDHSANHHVPFVLDDDVELSKKVGAAVS